MFNLNTTEREKKADTAESKVGQEAQVSRSKSVTAGWKAGFIFSTLERESEWDPDLLTQQINSPTDRLLQNTVQDIGNHLEDLLCS